MTIAMIRPVAITPGAIQFAVIPNGPRSGEGIVSLHLKRVLKPGLHRITVSEGDEHSSISGGVPGYGLAIAAHGRT
jgi:hypothetical protein